MAAPASTEDQWRRRWRRDDDDDDDDEALVGEEEEGEIVPGSHSDSETNTDEYYNRHSPSEYDDNEAISSRRGRAATSAVVPANIGSSSAASRPSSVAPPGWGGTGKRGRSGLGTGTAGGRAVSPSAQPDHHQSMAAVAAAAAPKSVVLQPIPLAFAPSSIDLPASSVPIVSAARTNLSGQSSSSSESVHDDDTMVTVVAVAPAGAAIPPVEAAVHYQPVSPPPSRSAPAAGRQNPDGYMCPKCGMWFATHQGLGGHSHKHREREQLLAAVPGGRDGDADAIKRRERRVHVCGDCGAEFATGVQLGGHKRKHWTGAPIVPKKKPRAVVVQPLLPPPPAGLARAADLVLPLPLPLPIKTDEVVEVAAPAPVVETTAQPAAATRSLVPGRVRLFGFDIVPAAVETAEAQQDSAPASVTKSSGGPPVDSSSHSQ